MTDTEFKAKVNQALKQRTVKQLAADLHVSSPIIKRWSEGKNMPALGIRKALAYTLSKYDKTNL